MALTDRKLMILEAIIDDYILTGIPVGSRTLSKRDDINLSSATIRNEMADLEEEGYLEQPHTSAGRLPSDKAYRLYVDTLMHTARLNAQEINYINGYFASKMGEVEAAIKNTAKVLSDITNLTSVVMTPQVSKIRINRIQLVKLSGQRALLVIVFNTGLLKDVMIQVPETIDSAYLDMISNMISERVRGLTLSQAMDEIHRIMEGEMPVHREFVGNILNAVRSNSKDQAANQIILGGTQNIFNHPEYRDVDKARHFLELLETKEPLYEMLSRSSDMEFTIRIGKENEIDALKDMSVVTATYRIGDTNLGSFGVIGPTRMDYSKVLSVMNYVGSSINELLSCFASIKDKSDQ